MSDTVLHTEAPPRPGAADTEVAVGAIAGLIAGSVMWILAMIVAAARAGEELFTPLRLVAATFMGADALWPENALSSVVLGFVLVGLTSVGLGLNYTSILKPRKEPPYSIMVGFFWSVGVWLVLWFVVTRVCDPVLFQNTGSATMLLYTLVFGLVLGLSVPFLRRVLAERGP